MAAPAQTASGRARRADAAMRTVMGVPLFKWHVFKWHVFKWHVFKWHVFKWHAFKWHAN